MENQTYNKFGALNLLTPEEKATYSGFAHKIHEMSESDLMKLNSNSADELTTEMKDIVAFEVKLREHNILAKRNIVEKEAFSPQAMMDKTPLDPTTPNFQKYRIAERELTEDMSDDLLEKSKKIIENTYIEVNPKGNGQKYSGGINLAMKKCLVVDDNGNKIKFNIGEINERFRKQYIKKLSEVTGIDYTVIDDTPSNEPDTGFLGGGVSDAINDEPIDQLNNLNLDEYEDD